MNTGPGPSAEFVGADDYLTKPAGAEEVLSAINARLDRHSEKEQAAMAR